MVSGKPEKLIFPLILFLAFLLIPLSAQPEMPPAPANDIQQGMMAAIKENREFAAMEAKRAAAWKQLETLREKLASRNPELKQSLNEQKKLQKILAEAGKTKKSDGETGRLRARLNEVRWQLEREFSKSGEYARLFLSAYRVSAEANLQLEKIFYSSSDERILKFLEAVEKTSGDYITYSVRNLPKAEVDGTDEYRAAVMGIEKYRENPHFKGTMEHHCSPVRQKMEWRAGKEPHIRELNRILSLTEAECDLRKCLIEEKNQDLAWEVRTLPTSPEFRTPEGASKYKALQEELNRIIQSDPEYAGLEEKRWGLRDARTKAVGDFAAKSNASEAVEYRKVKTLLDEVDEKAPAAKTK